jgi:uncharacterized membrane protein YphA (DoxX/SURF4 family)
MNRYSIANLRPAVGTAHSRVHPDPDMNYHRAMPLAPTDRTNRALAILFARLVLGFIFLMAGVYKVFELGPVGHARKWFLPFSDTFLPVWSLWAVGCAIPFVELVAGGLVLLGWRIREAAIALGAVLAIVTFGHLLHQPLYPFHEHVIPRLALLLFVLAMPRADDRFSVDFLARRTRQPVEIT